MKFTTRPLLRRRSLFPLLVAVAIAPLPAADRPNILWLVSEDNTSTFTGPYGDPLARTPAIDRLAGTGVVFTHAHSPAPVCAPTRSSIITGVYASSLGTQHMRSEHPLPPEVKFFPEFLRAAGYFTTNRAKTDYNTSTPHAAALSPANTAPLRLAAANIVANSPAFTPASLAALQGLPGLAERNFEEYYLNLLDLIASMP